MLRAFEGPHCYLEAAMPGLCSYQLKPEARVG